MESTAVVTYPTNWMIASDYDPNAHLMNLKGKDYLNVQHRMIWFIRDQRNLIARGLGQMAYKVNTEQVEVDRQTGYACFKTYVRDVLGNEAIMYGSETQKDFPDYAEKASTKSLGRALAMLGYGTQFAPEMDEDERVVDSPPAQTTRPHPPANKTEAAERATLAATPAPQHQPPAPAAANTPRASVEAWLAAQQIGTQALAAFCYRNKIADDDERWMRLASEIKKTGMAAQLRAFSWAFANNFTARQVLDYTFARKINFVQFMAQVDQDDRDTRNAIQAAA